MSNDYFILSKEIKIFLDMLKVIKFNLIMILNYSDLFYDKNKKTKEKN